MFTALKTIFWMALHAASALAATIILNLHSTDTLTEDRTIILKHMQTAAAVYYYELADEAIYTYAYQPNFLWEATVQNDMDICLALAQQPGLVLLTIIFAVVASVFRYHVMMNLLMIGKHCAGRNGKRVVACMLKLYRLLAKLASVLFCTGSHGAIGLILRKK